MYQSKKIEEYLSPVQSQEVEKEKAIEKIIRVLDYFSPIRNTTRHIFEKFFLPIVGGSAFLMGVMIFLAFHYSFFNPVPFYVVAIAYLLVETVVGWMVWNTFTRDAEFTKNNYLSCVKLLFLNLSNKPYEIKCEFTDKSTEKLKIVVEENLYMEGYIIKNKTRNFTAYIDLNESSKTILQAIIEIVKEAESMFTTK
jgi:hypothetical protein